MAMMWPHTMPACHRHISQATAHGELFEAVGSPCSKATLTWSRSWPGSCSQAWNASRQAASSESLYPARLARMAPARLVSVCCCGWCPTAWQDDSTSDTPCHSGHRPAPSACTRHLPWCCAGCVRGQQGASVFRRWGAARCCERLGLCWRVNREHLTSSGKTRGIV